MAPFDIDATDPADNDIVSQFPANERTHRSTLESLLGDDHDEGASGSGKHKKASLKEQASDPASVANYGILYTKEVSTITELFFIDSAGTVQQITTNGKLSGAPNVILTTRGDLVYRDASAPARLAIGASGRFLRSDGTDPGWAVPAATEVSYSPTTSGLVATTVQAAIDERIATLTKKTSDEADATSETVVAGLSNITIPGTPNGSRKYSAIGQLLLETATPTTDDQLMARVRVGVNGDVTDAIVWEGAVWVRGEGLSNGVWMIPIVIPEFTPAASTKLSVTFWSTDGAMTIRGDATVLESFIYVRMI